MIQQQVGAWKQKELHCTHLYQLSYNYADKIQFYQVILTTEGFSVNTIGIWEAGGRNPIQAA